MAMRENILRLRQGGAFDIILVQGRSGRTRAMAEILTDEQLVEKAVNDDKDAFGEIVRRWERKIFALCFGMLAREDEARDAAQETFFAAYRNLKNFRGEAKVSSWLHRIAVNQCLTTKRRQKTRSENFLDDETSQAERVFAAPSHLSPARTAEQSERLKIVRQAVSSLPPDLREVIVMKEFEEMTFQEISDTLDIPLSTVKSRVYTALKQLKMKLERTPLEVI
ncbi:MAG: sigma-70 family RNA polymerase sigma factor [Acidobacteria bacterium]|nr:sigma-70 family RNA polymerase sigma factor [Acidobacteriota bacterium]